MTSQIIDRKFIGLVSGRLKNITYKGSGSVVASFTHSCERANKRRAHFLTYKGSTFCKCFNCGASLSLSQFLKDTDQVLYKEYCMENFKDGVWETTEPQPAVFVEPKHIKPEFDRFDGLVPYEGLISTHPAIEYVVRRMIPKERYDEFFLAPKFYKWASKFDSVFFKFEKDAPRLIIPYYGLLNSNLLGFSCRAFGKETPKYIHLRVDEENEFIYGLSRLDLRKPILVVEGQIDSMLLDNAIAIGRASYVSDFLVKHKADVTIVPDNDFRRNFHVCNQLKKAILSGYTICILPSHWPKDINDMIKTGISKNEIQEYIKNNRKSGQSALLELALEKRC